LYRFSPLKSIALPRAAIGVSIQKRKQGKEKRLVKITPIHVLYRACKFSSNVDGWIRARRHALLEGKTDFRKRRKRQNSDVVGRAEDRDPRLEIRGQREVFVGRATAPAGRESDRDFGVGLWNKVTNNE